jgi:hypothetical protein
MATRDRGEMRRGQSQVRRDAHRRNKVGGLNAGRFRVTRALLAVIVCVAGSSAFALGRVDTPMSESDHVFEIVERIATAQPFVLDRIAAIVGFELIETGRSESAGFRYAKGKDPGSVIAAVEIREQLAGSPGRGGLVILDLADRSCIKQADVMLRFGAGPSLSVPTPHQPVDAPLYLSYPYDWGRTSFGFARSDEKCLTRIVLDATGA